MLSLRRCFRKIDFIVHPGRIISKLWNFIGICANRFIRSVGMSMLGGTCPWCGSGLLYGRTGIDFRICTTCEVTFDNLCPLYKRPNRSLGFSNR